MSFKASNIKVAQGPGADVEHLQGRDRALLIEFPVDDSRSSEELRHPRDAYSDPALGHLDAHKAEVLLVFAWESLDDIRKTQDASSLLLIW